MKLYDQNGLQKRLAIPVFPIAVADSPAASVNDYSPAGWGSTVSRLEITPASGGTVITGLNASVHQVGDVVVAVNDTATVTDLVTFPNQSSFSLAANRFIGIGGEDYDLLPGAGVLLLLTVAGWRFLL
ncbi:MAG TPA: hypothetical protein VLH80_07480 [Nitrospiraceae bacterium]|nr:hypothetical protein [Nitrospiraceae bacterium]